MGESRLPVRAGRSAAPCHGGQAVAFREASTPEFRDYAARIVGNAKALADACLRLGMPVLTGGTDNHLLLIDVFKGFGLTGRQAESALRQCGFTLNRNALPFDPNGPWYTSGLRVGTPAVTTLGMSAAEMGEIAVVMQLVLSNTRPDAAGSSGRSGKYTLDPQVAAEATTRVRQLLERYPLYPELDLDLMLDAVSERV
jgi:glycine hydroxymethyltransferase